MARRTAEAAHFKLRLSAEIQQHRATQEQLKRELAQHQQNRARRAREVESNRRAAQAKFAAESVLAMLELHLDGIAFYIGRDRRYRFHTRGFSAWTGVLPKRIDGFAFEEALLPSNVEALRPLLLAAPG